MLYVCIAVWATAIDSKQREPKEHEQKHRPDLPANERHKFNESAPRPAAVNNVMLRTVAGLTREDLAIPAGLHSVKSGSCQVDSLAIRVTLALGCFFFPRRFLIIMYVLHPF